MCEILFKVGSSLNIITSLHMRRKLARVHANNDVIANAIVPIIGMQFGNGGCTPSGDPIPPDATKDPLTLNNSIGYKPLDSATLDRDETSVTYQVALTTRDFNNCNINECALVDSANDIVAMATFGNKHKTSTDEIIFKWVEKI